MLFVLAVVFFWWISSNFWYGALIGEFVVVACGTLPYVYMFKNIEKIRVKYKEKHGRLAGQYFWYNYHSYTVPLLSVSLYFPLLLFNYDFLPVFIRLPSHFMTGSLLPFFISIPLGLIFIIFGFLILKPSISYVGNVVGNRLHLIYPERSKLVSNGIYSIIRNPQYLGRGIIAIGFGVFANSIIAVLVGLIHFLSFYVVIPAEDREMSNRFGSSFDDYKKDVPSLFPTYSNWGKFIRVVLGIE
jgi:protein-S-isoprenylcysteine O-methyltransferase Ste14